MLEKRLRFAPSPTGPLHIGGLRTALYNYVISKNQKGKFILRIEDTDLNRFDKKAEKHINDSLEWCGIIPDESPKNPGKFGPYRQSERKSIYNKHIKKLIENGKAYFAFDSTEVLDQARKEKEKKGETFIYNWENREKFQNSLSLDEGTYRKFLEEKNYVIRFKSYDKSFNNDSILIEDQIRGKIKVDLKLLDDKILFKNDGMPTYHLANVIDDHLMKISDVVRGEEWLPSLALHWQLYESFGWNKPNFAHLPLILKPTGKGKLSKRDGQKFGIPVYPISWSDNDITFEGFKEIGFEKEAFINFISMIGWNPGNEKEIFELDELINQFTIERIIKSGAKYDYEKAKWFNIEHIKKISDKILIDEVQGEIKERFEDIVDIKKIKNIIEIVRDRVIFRKDIINEIKIIIEYNLLDLKENISKINLSKDLIELLVLFKNEIKKNKSTQILKNFYTNKLSQKEIKFGDGMKALRLCISGKVSGADLFSQINFIKNEILIQRINNSLKTINDKNWNS